MLLAGLSLALAIGGGAGSVWLALEKAPPFGAVRAGPWVAFPSAGSREADPYSRARFARQGGIPLGRSEGIAFTAGSDSQGRALRRDCTYRIEGPMPAARFWTLHAADAAGRVLPPFGRRRAALHSRMVLRFSDDGFLIVVSPHPAPANWLAVTGEGGMRLVLTLYDTPVASGARLGELTLPQIARTGCDG
ncbi:DUF1214 domain-containing protein [Chelativorans intermedius]|uniref:DUF1214 domain-containing protein n=1 Tax=Chelativorans intermedius TaxID=515947 RepID=A0ABV6DD73_9HYPH